MLHFNLVGEIEKCGEVEHHEEEAARVGCGQAFHLDPSKGPEHLKKLYKLYTEKLRDATRMMVDVLFETTDLIDEGKYLDMVNELSKINGMCDRIEEQEE